MKPHLTTPNEDYLERISELLDEKGYARVTDIAERLNVKPASVTMMLKKLEASGYVIREHYRGFSLTTKGLTVGNKIKKRHVILSEFLTLLGLSKKTIELDIEGLEHSVSNETLDALEEHVEQIKKSSLKY